jgi:triacylglycerol esterase/lipase EstA (alpha/beta hydrolase family)
LQFDELHIVAHSMGGLVSKGTLNICAANRSCDYVRSYTTISTPWGGVASAENGTQWSPTVVPVWWDLVPSSEYLTTLFETPLPDDLEYHLLFGYRSAGSFGGESSDGVIRLSSQLRLEAQQVASSTLGVDAGHVDILGNEVTIRKLAHILEQSNK